MTGNRDYLLRVVAADLSSYEAFLEKQADAARRHRLDRVELCAEPGEVLHRTAGVDDTCQRQRLSYPAQAGYPVRCGFLGSKSLAPLGYWITRPSARLRTGRVTTTEYDFAISRRIPPEVCIFVALLQLRGRREDRVLAAPAVSRAICANKTAHEHTGQREHSGLPCAMALRLTSCSSRRTALLPPSPREKLASHGLSASTAAPEPHDFAVRLSHTRQSQLSRPSHLTARS